MKAKLKFKGRIIEIQNIKKVSYIGKITGLMFKKKETNALLFEFSKPVRKGIHSFFCKDFLAIWLNNGKIVEYKFIDKWQFSIKPRENFDKLIEIPINKKYREVIEALITKKPMLK